MDETCGLSSTIPQSTTNGCERGQQLFEFDALPEELQMKILSFLSPVQLCRSVAPVCRRWYRLANEPILWQWLQFDVLDVSKETVVEIMKRSPLLRQLELKGYTEMSFLTQEISQCRFLKHLELRQSSNIKEIVTSDLVVHCPLIETLNLEGSTMIDRSVLDIIVGWKRLKNISLSHCEMIDEEDVDLLSELPRLEALNIDGLISISDRTVLKFIEKRGPSLRKLHLDGTYLTDHSYRALAHCSHLVDLNVSFTRNLTDNGLMAIQELNQLKCLVLSEGSRLSAIGLQKLFEGPNLKNLIDIDLSYCSKLDDDGVESMTKCCLRVRNLNLSWCWDITDRGLNAIISNFTFLETLILKGLVDLTGECLMAVPACLCNLMFLDVSQCSNIMNHIIHSVMSQKPNLQILVEKSWNLLPPFDLQEFFLQNDFLFT